jgi:hypothetical protein
MTFEAHTPAPALNSTTPSTHASPGGRPPALRRPALGPLLRLLRALVSIPPPTVAVAPARADVGATAPLVEVPPAGAAARVGRRSTTLGPAPSPCGRVRPQRLPSSGAGAGSPDYAARLRHASIRRATSDPGPPQLPPPGPSTTTSWSSFGAGWDPTALASAYSTMALAPPPSDWVIDSGASYHTTPTTGMLSRSHPPPPTHPTSIVVGNSSTLPVTSVGASVLPGPFYLNDVLVAPHTTHNLLSVPRFSTDNSCSIEFDPTGFSVKDLATRTPLARCDSVGPLYTLRSSSTGASPPPVMVSTTTSTTWHRRLGHPGPDVMTKLSITLDSSCNRGHFEGLCHACQLGRHSRLPLPPLLLGMSKLLT